MTQTLFKRAVIFGDLHLGKKNNEKQFNEDCFSFIRWMCSIIKEQNVDCLIFLGDFHDNRHSLHLSTLDISKKCLKLLDDIGIPVYFISGNHDLLYKEKRIVSSLAIADNYSNITIINDFQTIGNCTFCPWLVGDEWKQIPRLAKLSTYMFGHFELPKFLMNAMVESPDHNTLKYEHFNDVEQWAFTGHFHKRQSKGKVLYIGNAFPHNFSDVWDDERGIVILDWGQEPEFIKWNEAPSYCTLKISELLDSPEEYLHDKMYARVTVDLNLTADDVQFIKETFQVHYSPRKLDMLPSNKQEEHQKFDGQIEFQSIDQIVKEGINSIDSVSMNKAILQSIYEGLA